MITPARHQPLHVQDIPHSSTSSNQPTLDSAYDVANLKMIVTFLYRPMDVTESYPVIIQPMDKIV